MGDGWRGPENSGLSQNLIKAIRRKVSEKDLRQLEFKIKRDGVCVS